jgi:hypothetical protein
LHCFWSDQHNNVLAAPLAQHRATIFAATELIGLEVWASGSTLSHSHLRCFSTFYIRMPEPVLYFFTTVSVTEDGYSFE